MRTRLVGRTQRALTSLVAAIPASLLCWLLVDVFLKTADSLQTATQVVAGVTLLLAAFVALMPIGIFVLGGKKATKPDEEVADKGAAGSEDDVEVADDDVEVADDEAEDLAETSDFDLDDSDANVMSDSSEEIETGPASSLDDIDAFDIDEEEEPKPKKKKK